MEMLKATLRSFDADAYTATVQVSGSLATWLEGVPVARNIAARHLTEGRTCALVFFDASNPVRRGSPRGVRLGMLHSIFRTASRKRLPSHGQQAPIAVARQGIR